MGLDLLKVFFGSYDRSARTESYYELWLRELERVGVKVHRAPIGRRKIVSYRKGVWEGEIKPKPVLQSLAIESYDIAVFEELYPYWCEPWEQIKIPKVLFIEDLYALGHRQIVRAIELGFDAVMFRYENPFMDLLRKLKGSCSMELIWLPHSVDTDYFKPADVRMGGVTLLGVVGNVYPTRQAVLEECKGEPFFLRIERPVETPVRKKKWPVDRDYAEIIAKSLICPTGGSKFHYAVSKFFEIPSCGTLLMSDWFPELGKLGFKPGENMVVLRPGHIKEQMLWWLGRSEERKRVESNGRKLIVERHSGQIRAAQFLDHVQRLVKK